MVKQLLDLQSTNAPNLQLMHHIYILDHANTLSSCGEEGEQPGARGQIKFHPNSQVL